MKTIQDQKSDLLEQIIVMLYQAEKIDLTKTAEENFTAAVCKYHNEPLFQRTAKYFWHLANQHAAKILTHACENLTGSILTDAQNLRRIAQELEK